MSISGIGVAKLSEIEAVLMRLPGIELAAVTTYEPQPGVVELAGYYTLRDHAAALDRQAAHQYLRNRLPWQWCPPTWKSCRPCRCCQTARPTASICRSHPAPAAVLARLARTLLDQAGLHDAGSSPAAAWMSTRSGDASEILDSVDLHDPGPAPVVVTQLLARSLAGGTLLY
jgi:hypothetical protein